jgi:predicted nucleotide-binding protein
MTLHEIKEILSANNYVLTVEKRVNKGTYLKTASGSVINCWDNGNISFQGTPDMHLESLLSVNGGRSAPQGGGGFPAAPPPAAPIIAPPAPKVFVVYGHDMVARTQLEAMLRRWGVEPLILDQLPSEGSTIIEKLEKYRRDANFAVVLATPDDEGHRAGHPDEKSHRARQNVVLEMGMLLALLGRSRVAVLLKDQTKTERPSDIQGLIYLSFRDKVDEVAVGLAKEMAAQGINIKVANL